jgi:hypothetical protein
MWKWASLRWARTVCRMCQLRLRLVLVLFLCYLVSKRCLCLTRVCFAKCATYVREHLFTLIFYPEPAERSECSTTHPEACNIRFRQRRSPRRPPLGPPRVHRFPLKTRSTLRLRADGAGTPAGRENKSHCSTQGRRSVPSAMHSKGSEMCVIGGRRATAQLA